MDRRMSMAQVARSLIEGSADAGGVDGASTP
jgi:hypothetical protein